MLCYKDMTFCKFYKTCKAGKKCGRALTPEIQKASEDFGLPICMFTEKPDCYKEKNK